MNKFKKLILLFLSVVIVVLLVQQPIMTLATHRQQAQTIELEAQQLYQENKFNEAIELLQRAIAGYRQQQDLTKTAIATRNLALVYQQLGQWEEARETLAEAEAVIAPIKDTKTKNRLQAQILEVRGQIELSLGQTQAALQTWEQGTALYQQLKDVRGFTQGKIYQAQALQAMGLYTRAIAILTTVTTGLETEADTAVKAKALLAIGNTLRRVGKYDEAQTALKSSLAISQQLNVNEPIVADTWLSLGTIAQLQQQTELAKEYYQQAIATSVGLDSQLQGKLKLMGLLVPTEIPSAKELVPDIISLLAQLPPNQTKIQGQIRLANYLIALKTNMQTSVNLLTSAIKQSRNLGIARTESLAWGTLGSLYEREQRWSEAQKLTEKALLVAQNSNASETYQWQWQLGRILRAQGNREEAITAYTQATENLRSLRSDLVAISSEVQFSFREQIEPVYRELAALLLADDVTQANLNQAREVIESLQVAELDNFFRDACLDAQPVQIDRLDPTAAAIYTIILHNRLEVIVAIPNKPLRHYTTELPASEIEIVVTSANALINNPRRLSLKPLQQAYDWLIRPWEAELEADNINTLVFVLDGVLRNLPPATLHDGDRYLIEKYPVAIAPSLQLVKTSANASTERELLLAGISQQRRGFAPLPGVKAEITQIEPLFSTDVLLNETFTEPNLARYTEKDSYRFLHLATHGQFSSQAENTFVLTWEDRLNIEELNQIIRGDRLQLAPIDLLVLSACQTAAGDNQATLGLAGMAVRAGARSTIASLWSVSDVATQELMTSFYRELAQNKTTKAEALRLAQLDLLQETKFAHPYFWSAFILVGNWL